MMGFADMACVTVRKTSLLLLSLFLAGTFPVQAAAQQSVDFRRDVYPLLAARCFECHQGQNASSGVRLDDRQELLGETTGRPLIKAGKSQESRLIQLVSGLDTETVMPPKGKGQRLTEQEVAILRGWIDQGLAWDETLLPRVLSRTDHWAFQPLKRPEVPAAENPSWLRNPIDAFIAEGHREHGLKPAGPAARRVLIRRLYLDMLGLLPTPEEVESFVADPAPHAYEQLIERVLCSPHYGERWGRYWLDVARWSETEGYESNHPRPFAWRYRDYVVASFNSDKPFDRFIRQQIAGDEMVPYSDENLIATGFLAAARISSNEEDKWLQRNDILVDVSNTTASAFLGLTINCAQCHNHKFDPITLRDYYRLQGFFLQGQPVNVALKGAELRRDYETKRPPEYEQAIALKTTLYKTAHQRLMTETRKSFTAEELEAIDTPSDQRSVEQELLVRAVDLKFQVTPKRIESNIPQSDRKLYDELKKKIAEIEKQHIEPQTFAFYSPITSPHELKVLPSIGFYPLPYQPDELARKRPYLQVRGDVHNIGPKVKTGWPVVFDTAFEFESKEDKRISRTTLAAWMTHPHNPLTARVWVNRIWQYHFGRGLVPNPGDFGSRADQPELGELLDWLATELIDSGFSTKHLQRLILTSNSYRMASEVNPHNAEIDPENAMLWHWAPRRLEVEAIRDAMLAISGELDSGIGGKSVALDDADQSTRRSLYLYQKRGNPPQMQSLFDGPSEASESCARRHTSTTALQSLYLLNNRFTLERARKLAEQLETLCGPNRRRHIETAFVRILGRAPEADEVKAANIFFAVHAARKSDKKSGQDSQQPSPLVQFCQALLNLNEFVYIE